MLFSKDDASARDATIDSVNVRAFIAAHILERRLNT
jgi:hypothetical protein